MPIAWDRHLELHRAYQLRHVTKIAPVEGNCYWMYRSCRQHQGQWNNGSRDYHEVFNYLAAGAPSMAHAGLVSPAVYKLRSNMIPRTLLAFTHWLFTKYLMDNIYIFVCDLKSKIWRRSQVAGTINKYLVYYEANFPQRYSRYSRERADFCNIPQMR